ncbi:dihydrodipicolinate synthase family protein [Agromyces sp. MMS24-K17]|uniref:dihydrodipicolinate synthase family protein n=1 Tax=Agromyces sp. MMS24-K17 TaxID=3372850 RepID=UPI00375430CB
MTTPAPTGVWPVMLTPFDADGRVDLAVLDRYTDWLIDQGAAGLFPVALSGEMYELTPLERLLVAERVVHRAAGRVPVAAAIASAGTDEEVADAVGRLAATGVDIVVLVASVALAEGEPDQRLLDLVDVVAAANPDVALGVYECPMPYHRVLRDETVGALAETGRFAFFKETSHDVGRMATRVWFAEGTPLRVFDAGIETLAQSVAAGTAGLSGWIANVHPDAVARLIDLVRAEGASPRALALQAALGAAEQAMGPTYPASAKVLVDLRSGIGFAPRSRWRPAEVVPAELADLLAQTEREVAAALALVSSPTARVGG